MKSGKTKQALVVVTYVSCGCGSCDGGSSHLFAFDMRHHRPHLFWRYETGSRAYGEGLKFITFQDHKLVTEQFRRCSDKDKERDFHCWSKYHAKNIIRQTFVFNGSTFVKQSKEIIETLVVDVALYSLQLNVGQLPVLNSED